MPSHDSTLDDIKDRIDIIDFISEYVHLKKAGQNWKGLCPFHTEKTPSFTVSPAKQIFHCFGCGTGGDIFTFLMRHENLAFPEALSMLARKAGVTLKVSQKSRAGAGEKETLLNLHKDALSFFQQQLVKNSAAMGYLKRRGIDGDAQKLFSLGYAPKSWNALLNYLARRGYKAEAVRKAGLAVQGQKGVYDTFRDRIIFPIYDIKRDVVAFGGRSMQGGEPKYLNSPETLIFNKGRVLYGLDRAKDSIRESGHALFMEGYLDVITAHVHGFTSAVAPLGTALTPQHGKLIKRFTEDVIIVFDSDPAGIKAAKNAASILLEGGLNVKLLSVPGQEDPDSFLRKKGRDMFQKLLEQPLSVVDFIVRQGGRKYQLAREVLEAVSRVPNSIIKDEYLKELSEKLQVEERLIRDEFNKVKKQLRSGYRESESGAKQKPERMPLDELYIIRLLLQLPEERERILDVLSVDDFSDMNLRGIFKKIKNGLHEFDELLMKCEGREKDALTGISVEEVSFEEPEKVLADCIQRMKEKRRRILLKEIQGRIKEAEKNKDSGLLRKLQLEQQNILRAGTSGKNTS